MRIAFRVDASLQIGSGHIMRCLSLADELSRQGHETTFYCLPLTGHLMDRVLSRGHKVISLGISGRTASDTANDYEHWLPHTQKEDAQHFLEALAHPVDRIIVDHYSISQVWEKVVKHATGCLLIAIDDLTRCHAADIVIDQTLGREPSEYFGAGEKLCGSDYAILDAQFAQQRERALEQSSCAQSPRILVTFGAVDQDNVTLKVLQALANFPNCSITVLLSRNAPHFASVASFAESHCSVTHIEFTDQIASLMVTHDLAVGAPGTTSWERACLGLPSIIIPIADNQAQICKQLTEQQVSIGLPPDFDQTSLWQALEQLQQNWPSYQATSFKICDGLGLYRVAAKITQRQRSTFHLMKASAEHKELTYTWQCHPNTRKHALNTALPSWQEHCKWFDSKCDASKDFFYIIVKASTPVGVVRLDRTEPSHYVISIYVSPDHYRQGVAQAGLQLINLYHPSVTIAATVLEQNHASQALFKKCGYQKLSAEHFLRPPLTER